MFVHNLDPVIFSVGPLTVRWYGLVYVIGFLLAYWALYRAADNEKISNWTRELTDDFMLWVIVGVVAGGRLGYFLFYNIHYFWTDPLEILMIWHGGMSFHGGLLGVVLATYWFVERNDVSFYELADVLSLPAAVALGLGRIANFVNAELVGVRTDVSWCVEFPGFDGCRHPAQLYLSLKNFAVAGLLWFLDREDRRPGFIFWNFVLWYGTGRFLIDFWRIDPRFLGISMGQYLSLAMVLVAGYVLWSNKAKY